MSENSFFRWWFTQLVSLVPEPLRRGWRRVGKRLTLDIDRDKLTVTPAGKSDGIVVDLPSTASNTTVTDTNLRSRIPPELNTLTIRLAPHEFLVRRFNLPTAARTHLTEAVGYQLPRLLPFSSGEVIYACGIERETPAEGTLSVWLAAVPRRRLAVALKLLGIDLPEATLPINSPPEADERLSFTWHLPQKSGMAPGSRRLLWTGALACWIAAVGVHLYNKQTLHQELSSTLTELQIRATEVGQLRNRLTDITSKVDWLNRKRQTTVSILHILDVLTRELEDDTWLQTLELNGDKLSVQGLSHAPASLIEKLEEAPLLRDVRFEAAITQDTRSKGSRFSISARLGPIDQGDGA